MAKGIIILGNGFDLDIGLNSSYADFARSRQWSELMNKNKRSEDDSYLLGFLRSKHEIDKWIDIEASLLEYALNKTNNGDIEHSSEDEEDYFALCNSLKIYLTEQQEEFEPRKTTVAFEMLKRIARLSIGSKVYTFNYTNLMVLAKKIGINMSGDVEHIHGSLDDEGDLILGIESNMRIEDKYAFLFKTQNPQYRHTDILKDLENKDEYVFFGHSLNGMDYTYFHSLFSKISFNIYDTPRLTIVTKNLDSENMFKNFLRRQNISLQGLYSNTIPIFILTDDVYGGKESELKEVQELLNRVYSM